MKRIVARIGATLVLAGAGGLLASSSGCADNESSLFVRGVMLVDPKTCVVTPDPEGVFIAGGRLDAAISLGYTGALLVGNQLVPRGDGENLRTETSRVELYAADVSIQSLGGSVVQRGDGSAAEYSVPITGFVDPGSDADPGYGIAFVLLIDAATAKDLQATVAATGLVQELVASVIVRGHTLGGNELETPEYQFPISVCSGCLVTFPGEADDPANPGPDCLLRSNVEQTACLLGQDSAVDCRLCSASLPACNP